MLRSREYVGRNGLGRGRIGAIGDCVRGGGKRIKNEIRGNKKESRGRERSFSERQGGASQGSLAQDAVGKN